MKKIPFLILSVLLLISSVFPKSFAAYSYEEPVEPNLWENAAFRDDHAYSIAFVGDTQYLCRGDYYQGTKKMEQLKHVFVLGDITDMGYHNDGNLATTHYDPPITGEWELAQRAIFQMNTAGISYSLCRGNHDDYMMDDYFNVPAYTDQFKDCGGFFSDSDAKHPVFREKDNPDGYIYWSAVTGYHENSIVNSYKTETICGNKYLFITVDYNPTEDVVKWVDRILGEYPDHLAIVATHSYLNSKGQLRTTEQGDTRYPLGYAADKLWDMALRKHENLLMVACGHVGATVPVYSTKTGDHGNTVHQFLVNPQSYDTKEAADGSITRGTQDTGLVLYMNFSEDGSKISLDYYATLLNKEMKAVATTEITRYEENPLIRIPGDTDANKEVDQNDAIYLLYHIHDPNEYPLRQNADYDRNGSCDVGDAIYLLYHVYFPEYYPLLQ